MALSRILAIRMVGAAISISLFLTAVFFIRYIADTPHLREATLDSSVLAIAKALSRGDDPAQLPAYRNYPNAYGFRVFDRRSLASRHILASANIRWLPAVQHLQSTAADPDGDHDRSAVGTDLIDGFVRFRPRHARIATGHVVSRLIHRVVLPGHKYWIQAYMIGDPAWLGARIIADKLLSHVFFPILFIVPALTLAMFFATRGALQPLRRLSAESTTIAEEVARGRTLTPVSSHGMAREFADVAAAINAMLAKLEHSLQLQKQFASDAAHELRTPLAVLLLEVAQLPKGPARDRIKADLEELGRLVNELLRFAQAEDVMAHELDEVDVVSAARKVCEDAVPQAIASRHLVEFESAAPRLVVRGNAALIEIAIRNLVENALKYSPEDTTVSVSVRLGPVVSVEDRGPGIPESQRRAIFERFWRVDRGVGTGAGVGLALARRIAQLHGGQIRIEAGTSDCTRILLSLASQSRSLPPLEEAHDT